jgi:nucleotide-binding universal stress UspA family protein
MRAGVVVGVDGSATAKEAVRWAAREAELRGSQLTLVTAWEVPLSALYGYGFAPVSEEILDGGAEGADELLATTRREARVEFPGVEMETLAMEGNAAHVLLEASREADLLVVGSRGLGGFRELLLGSVSQQCAHHATCPVVIVRHEDRAA